MTYNELAFGPQSLWDMEQVEVWRGPQSYIQGRNAIVGAIVMTSKESDLRLGILGKGGRRESKLYCGFRDAIRADY